MATDGGRLDGLTRPPVLDKTDMYKRWMAGEFGNSIECWLSLDDFYADVEAGKWPRGNKVALRYRGKLPGSPICIYDIPTMELPRKVEEVLQQYPDAERDLLVVNSSENDDSSLIVQGEVMIADGRLYLMYTRAKKKMRLAFKEECLHAFGLKAKLILDYVMQPVPREWLDEMLYVHYPDHVVEFSVWEKPWGTLNWNTIMWECRLY